jgi:hypothetical protein
MICHASGEVMHKGWEVSSLWVARNENEISNEWHMLELLRTELSLRFD